MTADLAPPDPTIPDGLDALMARPEAFPPHVCTCGDLSSTIDRSGDRRPETVRVRAALDRPGALASHYQPIVDVASSQPVAYEALLRLTDADGPVAPGPLFAAAATGGWAQALDQVARCTAIEGAAGWLRRARLFVNFVPSSIYDPAVCLRTTEEAASRAGVSMDQLTFEVIETESIRDIPHLRSIFRRYHEMGAQVALDDVGAGHASLDVAEELRPDVIKLDGRIVRAAVHDDRALAFVERAVAFARTGDPPVTVLAEGVEDAEQLALVRDAGVDLVQGWHLGRPGPAPLP